MDNKDTKTPTITVDRFFFNLDGKPEYLIMEMSQVQQNQKQTFPVIISKKDSVLFMSKWKQLHLTLPDIFTEIPYKNIPVTKVFEIQAIRYLNPKSITFLLFNVNDVKDHPLITIDPTQSFGGKFSQVQSILFPPQTTQLLPPLNTSQKIESKTLKKSPPTVVTKWKAVSKNVTFKQQMNSYENYVKYLANLIFENKKPEPCSSSLIKQNLSITKEMKSSGAWGRISELNDPNFVLKEISFPFNAKEKNWDRRSIIVWQKEAYFMEFFQKLFEKQPVERKITPMIRMAGTCFQEENKTPAGFLVLEKFDHNMLALGEDQRKIFKEPTADIVLTEECINRMFEIAYIMGLLYVIHGDLKTDQFLWKDFDPTTMTPKRIVITDFGFSGGQIVPEDHPFLNSLGWVSQISLDRGVGECKKAFSPMIYEIPIVIDSSVCSSTECFANERQKYAIMNNLFQLELELLFLKKTVVIASEDGSHKVFCGLKGLQRDPRYVDFCSEYNDETIASKIKNIPAKDRFYVNYANFSLSLFL